jgi:hypothetical protein
MRFLSILIGVVILSGCQSLPQAWKCNTPATVVDHSGLDGCGLLLQLIDGSLLLPMNADEFDLKAGEQVRISYQQTEAMSICMKEDQIVKLTCLQPVRPTPCSTIVQLEDAAWLVALRDSYMPSKIIQYHFRDVPMFQIITSTEERWYDCRGNLRCVNNDTNHCVLDPTQLKDKVELYVAHR